MSIQLNHFNYYFHHSKQKCNLGNYLRIVYLQVGKVFGDVKLALSVHKQRKHTESSIRRHLIYCT